MGKMKTLFGITAAVLLTISLLFVSLPETASARKMTKADIVKIKKMSAKQRRAFLRNVARYKRMDRSDRESFVRFVMAYRKMNAWEREALRIAIAAYNNGQYQPFCSVERVKECYPVASPNSPACVSMCRQISTETCLSSGRSNVTQIATGLICSR